MNLNNLLLSLVSLCGILALVAAQENESPHRLLRGLKKSSLRHSEKAPKAPLSVWLSAKNDYMDLMSSTPTVESTSSNSAVLPMMYEQNGIDLLRQSYQLSNQFLPDSNNPAAEYAVLSIEAVENEYVSQDSVQAANEYVQEEVVEPVECLSADEVDYKGTSAEICSRIRFFCEEGFEYFGGNDCGCGCKPVAV